MIPPAPQKSLSGAITSEDRLVEKPGLDLLVELGLGPRQPDEGRAGTGEPNRPTILPRTCAACASSRRAAQAQPVIA